MKFAWLNMRLDLHQKIGLGCGVLFFILVMIMRPVFFRLLLRLPTLNRYDLLYLVLFMAAIPLGVLVVNLVRRVNHPGGWGLIAGSVVLYMAIILIFNDLLLLYVLDPVNQYSLIYLLGMLFSLVMGFLAGIISGRIGSNRWSISLIAAITAALWLFSFNLGFRVLMFLPGY